MPEQHTSSRWARFCAAMVKDGHGRNADIAVISANRRRPAPSRPLQEKKSQPAQMRSMRYAEPGLKPAGLHSR